MDKTLTKEQLRDFHERLLASQAAAEALLAQPNDGVASVETSGGTIGRLTRIDAIQLQGMSELNRGQLHVRLAQIKAALAAFDAGRFGQCNRCKDWIAIERLEALPEAPLCMPCQEAVELT